MSEQEQPQKIETVTVTLNVPLTPKFYKMLQGLSAIVGLPVETILIDDLYASLGDYFSGEHFKGWIDWLAEKNGIETANISEVEKDLHAVRATLF